MDKKIKIENTKDKILDKRLRMSERGTIRKNEETGQKKKG